MRRPRSQRATRRLRPTRAGGGFLAIIFGVGLAALNTGNNLLYLVLAALLAFLVLSGLLSEASLRGLRVERRVLADLHAGSETPVTLRLVAEGTRVPGFAVTLEDRIESASGTKTAGRGFVVYVAPGETAETRYGLRPDARGPLRFVDFRLATRFPFGLFVKSLELSAPLERLVYPSLAEPPAPSQRQSAKRAEAEARHGTRPGDVLGGLREFADGDSLARVHWTGSLRSGRLLVGLREPEGHDEVELALAWPPQAEPEEIELRIAQAAAAIDGLLAEGAAVGLSTPAGRIPPRSGRRQRSDLMRHLALIPARSGERGERPDAWPSERAPS